MTTRGSRPASRLSTSTGDSIELGTISNLETTPKAALPYGLSGTPVTTTPTMSASASAASVPSSTMTLSEPVEEPSTLRSVSICLSAFAVVFTTCGGVFAFGVYQELYQSMSLQPGTPFTGASPAVIDLIGTLSAAFMTIFAPLATAWTKRFGPRNVIFLGATLLFVASMLASYSVHVWQFLLTQGFLMGFATSFSYLPAVTVAPTWYTSRRGLAMGIILSGTGVGGLVWAPVIHILNDKFGFRNALRVSGAVTTALVAAGGFILDWDPQTKKRHEAEIARLKTRPQSRIRAMWDIPLVDWRIARSRMFVGQLLSSLVQAMAYFTPVFFFSAYARTLHYTPRQGANFIAIHNAANAVGKIIVGILADKWGRINMLMATTTVSAIASLAFWLPSTIVNFQAGQGLFVTYAIIYGAAAGPYTSLFPTCAVEVFGPQHFASINGVLYMSRGLGSLIGTPTAGALIRGSGHADASGYLSMTIMVAVLLCAASVGTLWIRLEAKHS